VPALGTTSLLEEGREIGGLPLAARPELHALVKDGNSGVVGARCRCGVGTVALENDTKHHYKWLTE
jgi:hypothetical protein